MSACVQIKVIYCQIFILHTSLAPPVYSRYKTYFLKNPWFVADTLNLQVVAVVSCMFVVVSTLCLIFSTLPRFQQKDENGIIRESSKTLLSLANIAKDCLLTLVKSRLALGSPGCLFVRSFVTMPKMAQYKENGYWLHPSDHIQSETLFQTRQDQEKEMNGSASLLHSWRLVLLSSSSQYCHAKYYRHNRHHLIINIIIIVITIVIIVIIIVILNQRRKTFSRSLRLFSSAGSPLNTLCGSLLPRESLSKYIVHGIGKTWGRWGCFMFNCLC